MNSHSIPRRCAAPTATGGLMAVAFSTLVLLAGCGDGDDKTAVPAPASSPTGGQSSGGGTGAGGNPAQGGGTGGTGSSTPSSGTSGSDGSTTPGTGTGTGSGTGSVPPAPAVTVTLMPFGDSMTEGGNPESSGFRSYRGELQRLLSAAGARVDFVGRKKNEPAGGGDPDHEGYYGQLIGPLAGQETLDDKVDPMLEAAPSPKVIVMAFGWNTAQYYPRTAYTDYQNIVRRVQAKSPNSAIIVATLSPRPNLTTDQTGSAEPGYAEINRAARDIANASATDQIWLADIAAKAYVPGDYADSLHWSASGALKAAEAIQAAINQSGALKN